MDERVRVAAGTSLEGWRHALSQAVERGWEVQIGGQALVDLLGHLAGDIEIEYGVQGQRRVIPQAASEARDIAETMRMPLMQRTVRRGSWEPSPGHEDVTNDGPTGSIEP
ncbi:hypothetical protein L332_03495 [Agrococcus pavilionensis RW1]|uniref:Uncharacterized protein n=2 Tax=Agrococcus TaxID=46352 RepID=U1L957_9MICO|nr:hypothetical protein L332_03495 [Agrococcus pavilionensis RW1]